MTPHRTHRPGRPSNDKQDTYITHKDTSDKHTMTQSEQHDPQLIQNTHTHSSHTQTTRAARWRGARSSRSRRLCRAESATPLGLDHTTMHRSSNAMVARCIRRGSTTSPVNTAIPRDVQGPARSDDRESVLRLSLDITVPAASLDLH